KQRSSRPKPAASKAKTDDAHDRAATGHGDAKRAWMWIGLIALAGLGLRLPGLFTDFWLDEVWAWELVNQLVHSPIEVFTKVRLNGNHPLNTMLMYLMGGQQALAVYRIP